MLEAEYVAHGLAAIICILSPQRVITGGGIMQVPGLLAMVRENVLALLNGYVQVPAILEEIDKYIVLPVLGGEAGVLGAIALAQQAASQR